MIKIGLAATNDAAGLDNKNVSAFIELAQKNDCEVIKGESEFFEPEEAKRVANGLKDCDLIVVTVKGFTWFGECINEFTKLGVPVCCWAVPEPKKEGVLLFNSMTGLNLFTSVANSGREIRREMAVRKRGRYPFCKQISYYRRSDKMSKGN